MLSFDALRRDLRYALRGLRASPMFAAVALLTLAVASGANTAVFSVVNSVLLEPLPPPDADELVSIWHDAPGAPGTSEVSGGLQVSPSMYFTYAEHNRSFEQVGLRSAATRQRLLWNLAERVEAFAVQREAFGFRDARFVLDFYDVPDEVIARVGAKRPAELL